MEPNVTAVDASAPLPTFSNPAVQRIVDEVLTQFGVNLYDGDFSNGVLAVFVDGTDGVDIDTVAHISRKISRLLDEQDPIAGAYQLEVSTPGLERRLRTSQHFAGAVGERVKVKMMAGYDGPRRCAGTLETCDGQRIFIRVDDSNDVVPLPIALVDRAVTEFEWGNPEKPPPGSAKAKGAHRSLGTNSKQSSPTTNGDGPGHNQIAGTTVAIEHGPDIAADNDDTNDSRGMK